MEENWKQIKGLEGRYEISDFGNVKSIRKRVIMGTTENNRGYLNVTIFDGVKHKRLSIHVLVCSHFIDNPENKKCVNHKDGNKKNNKYTNLEPSTYSQNNKHAYDTGLKKSIGFKGHKTKRPVRQLSMDGFVVKEYESIKAAARGGEKWSKGNILACLVGNRNSAYNFKWEFI